MTSRTSFRFRASINRSEATMIGRSSGRPANSLRYKRVAFTLAGLLSCAGAYAGADMDGDRSENPHSTVTPIKHVIVLIGENRSFDNVFGTYLPHGGQDVSNLLSKGIVTANGQPGPHSDLARQYQVITIPSSYFI